MTDSVRDWLNTQVARWSVALLYTAAMSAYLLQPESTLAAAGLPAGEPSLWRELIFSAGHVVGFGGLAVVWQRVAQSHMKLREAIALTAAGTIVYGILIEYAQAAVPGRSVQVSDMLANALGVALALVWRYRHATRD